MGMEMEKYEKGFSGGPMGGIVGGYPLPATPEVNIDQPRSLDKIREKRKCEDSVFLLLFISFLVGMVANSSFGFNKGDPHKCMLIYGLDYKGNVCGNNNSDPDVREFEVRYWQNPNQVYQRGLHKNPLRLADARSICLKECPIPSDKALNWVCDYPEGPMKLTMDDWLDINYEYYEFLSYEQRKNSL